MKITLARPLNAAPVAEDFRAEQMGQPMAAPDEILVRTIYLSLDPYIGSILRGRHMGEPPVNLGEVIPGRAVAEVLAASGKSGFHAGDYVIAETGWRSHAAIKASRARRIDPRVGPLAAHLGVLGMPGLTAFAGIHHLAKAGPGDHVLISSAAGPVGGTAGQIARIEGAARVIGIAGGAEKCRLVTSVYGFDACIDYKEPGWKEALAKALPKGADIYFDNVGGDVLQSALLNLAIRGRVVLCGLASQYHVADRPMGPNPGLYIGKRAQLFGLVVYDFFAEQDAYARRAAHWIKSGKLQYKEDMAEGLATAPQHFARLMRGENIGKALVRVAPEKIE